MTDFVTFLPGQPLPAGDLQAAAGEWFQWTPVLSVLSGTNPTLGVGGSAVGEWHNNNGLVTAQFDIFFGSSGVAAGSGIYAVSTPVNLTADWDIRLPVGQVSLWDATGPVVRLRTIRFNTVNSVVMSAEDGSNVTNAVPQTWAAGDHIHGILTYKGEAAA